MAKRYWCVPGPEKPGHILAIERAAARSFAGVNYQLTCPTDPRAWVSKPFLLGLRRALDLDLGIGIRLPHDVPCKGHWLELAGGKVWDTPYYPDPATWGTIGGWHSHVRALVDGVCAMGYSKAKIRFLLSNEPGIGGANGPCRGRWSALRAIYADFKRFWIRYLATDDPTAHAEAKALFLQVFPSWCWVDDEPLSECEIPLEHWVKMRRLRFSASYSGYQVVGLTLETQNAKVELDSIGGADAMRYFGATQAIEANVYTGSAIQQAIQTPLDGWTRRDLQPTELAARWAGAVERIRSLVSQHPLLARLAFGVTEANVLEAHVPKGADLTLYRQAMIDRAKTLECAGTVGVFTAVAQDGISTGAGLYTLEADKLAPFGSWEVRAA